VRDYAQVRGNGEIDRSTANAALTMLEVDATASTKSIAVCFWPSSKNTTAARSASARWPQPWRGTGRAGRGIRAIPHSDRILDRTPRGRVATRLAYEHFGLTMPGRQTPLF